jgi:hypothetical protein
MNFLARSATRAFALCAGAMPLAVLAAPPEWLPASITLPEPHAVLMDQKIGSNTHLLQIVVETDPTPMFADWQSALVAAGYDVNDSMMFDGRLLFSSSEVESGQIAVQSLDEAEFMIQIDMTMVPD